ncbi:putative RCC1 and BTB domain-containing protein [Phytophthora cinnamomi]|uniref:putative RCC1 and BTB domain-containing protein n=1 Tax=Phytophthora cinnamomi TaxID=4785 RepID=UPI00355A650C|nr:putative RCC1 and BTB domain-containing protein [Phytophthora cinnamomi]
MAANHLLATPPAFALPLASDDEDEGDALNVDGVYSFGQNTYGELALGDTRDRGVPTPVDLGVSNHGKRVVDVACGNEQTAILFEDGDVYTCGYNDSGQCAIGTTERVPTLQFSPGLSSNRTVRIFSGNGSEHLAALHANGNLYTVGFNMRGQLGLGSSTTVMEATLVEELAGKRVADVGCSYFHTAIVMDNGDLYACGCNDYGQLGLGDHHNGELVPRPVEYFFRRPVLAVACGQHYTVASLRDGGVVAFGKNDHGQLGLDSTSEPVLQPTRLAAPLDRAVVPQLSCGYHHTAVVTEDGAVYTFGRNDYGQLGLGHKMHMARPARVESLARMRITQVACGCYHTLALSDDGKVYPFGRNNHGQLGLETSVDCLSPQLISVLRNKTVTKVAAGFYHSVCLVGATEAETPPANGSGTLSGDLRKMLNNSTRSDVTFVVEGRPLFAHSCILVARCEPLEKMLDGRMKDGLQPEIVIPEYSYDVFAALMEFLYTDQVIALSQSDLFADFVLELHALADQYLVTRLRSTCENALLQILSVENVVIIMESAHFRNAYTLKKRCLSFVLDHFARVIATQAFVGLPQELLQEVLLMASHQGVSIPNQTNTGGGACSEYLRDR